MTENINMEQLEKDLVQYFATLFNLTIDVSIFRGQIPETRETGIAVRIIDQDAKNAFDHATFTVQVSGKFEDREHAWVMLTKLASEFPQYGVHSTNFVFVFMLQKQGLNAPEPCEDRGKVIQSANFYLRIAVLTKPATVANP